MNESANNFTVGTAMGFGTNSSSRRPDSANFMAQSTSGYYQSEEYQQKNDSPSKSLISRSGSGSTNTSFNTNYPSNPIVYTIGHRQPNQESLQDTQQSVVHPEDSLEYFIKFPTPSLRNETNAPESDFVFVYKETNVPIVMLLGWAGCQDRYLMKYSKIYEERG